MTLLDAYALVAFLAAEPAGAEVRELMRREAVAMTSVNLAEAIDVLGRVHQLEPVVVRPRIDVLADVIEFRTTTTDDAWRAADMRTRYYQPRVSEISLADCFLLASARDAESIATSDRPLAAAARAEGVTVAPLPDRNGRRP